MRQSYTTDLVALLGLLLLILPAALVAQAGSETAQLRQQALSDRSPGAFSQGRGATWTLLSTEEGGKLLGRITWADDENRKILELEAAGKLAAGAEEVELLNLDGLAAGDTSVKLKWSHADPFLRNRDRRGGSWTQLCMDINSALEHQLAAERFSECAETDHCMGMDECLAATHEFTRIPAERCILEQLDLLGGEWFPAAEAAEREVLQSTCDTLEKMDRDQKLGLGLAFQPAGLETINRSARPEGMRFCSRAEVDRAACEVNAALRPRAESKKRELEGVEAASNEAAAELLRLEAAFAAATTNSEREEILTARQSVEKRRASLGSSAAVLGKEFKALQPESLAGISAWCAATRDPGSRERASDRGRDGLVLVGSTALILEPQGVDDPWIHRPTLLQPKIYSDGGGAFLVVADAPGFPIMLRSDSWGVQSIDKDGIVEGDDGALMVDPRAVGDSHPDYRVKGFQIVFDEVDGRRGLLKLPWSWFEKNLAEKLAPVCKSYNRPDRTAQLQVHGFDSECRASRIPAAIAGIEGRKLRSAFTERYWRDMPVATDYLTFTAGATNRDFSFVDATGATAVTTFAELADLAKQESETDTSLGASWSRQAGNNFYRVGYEWRNSHTGGTSAELCVPVEAGGAVTRCLSTVLGGPTKRDQNLGLLEWRTYLAGAVGFRTQLYYVDRAFRSNQEITGEWEAHTTLFFLQNKEKGLNGGLDVAYDTFFEKLTARVFIGQAFSLFN